MNIRQIKEHAWQRLGEARWFGPIIVSFFIILMELALNLVINFVDLNNTYLNIGMGLMLQICLLQPFTMGYKKYILGVAKKEEVSVGYVFDGFSYAIKLIPYSIIMLADSYLLMQGLSFIANSGNGDVKKMLLGILMAAASIFVSFTVEFAVYILCDKGEKPFSCLFGSFKFFIKGNILKYILLYLSFILWFVGIAISFGTLTFFVLPYVETSIAVFYLANKQNI